jgi:hypothetical protein
MPKHYVFYKEDILNLLWNHKVYVSNKVKQMIKEGKDPRQVTIKETRKLDEDFLNEEIEKGAVNLETILDEVDKVLETTHGKTVKEMAKERIKI